MKNIRDIILRVNCFEKKISHKVRDPSHLTDNYRGTAHRKSKNNVIQRQNNFISFLSPNIDNYDWHLFFEKSVDEKKDSVYYDSSPPQTKLTH